VYSNGVIHHAPQTQQILREMHRVLRPGGKAVVIVYHRGSLKYFVSIMILRRRLPASLLLSWHGCGGGEAYRRGPDVLEGHRSLLREHGIRYLMDHRLFLSTTRRPGESIIEGLLATSRLAVVRAFAGVRATVPFLNLRVSGRRVAVKTALAERIGHRWDWHLWIEATK